MLDGEDSAALTWAFSPALVDKYGLGLSKEESQQLASKYDLQDDGRFAYCDFIQSCVLLLRGREASLLQRMKIQNAHKMVRGVSGCSRGGGPGGLLQRGPSWHGPCLLIGMRTCVACVCCDLCCVGA